MPNPLLRRLHLYLGLALLPWLVMYGASALLFSHPGALDRLYGGRSAWAEVEGNWTRRFERHDDERIAPDAGAAERRAFAARMLARNDLDCAFNVGPVRDGRLEVWCTRFLRTTRVRYELASGRLVADDKSFRIDQLLTGMHGRGGFHQQAALDDAWALVIDLVCLALLLWLASGLTLWWRQPRLRLRGACALLAGLTSFLGFLLGL